MARAGDVLPGQPIVRLGAHGRDDGGVAWGCRPRRATGLSVYGGRSAVPMGTPTTSTIAADPTVAASPDVRVLLIDGRHERRDLMRHVVEQGGPAVSVVGYADGPVTAVDAVDRLGANAVLLEIQLPVTQGLDTISALRHDYPDLRIVVCSFHRDATTKRDALARGADAYLLKPLRLRELHRLLRSPQPDSSAQGDS
jgi:CheY-like chemotaxis protein